MTGIGVVALDGSATAEYVLPWATALARGLDLRLLLLRLVPEAWPGGTGDARAEAALSTAQHYLDGVAGALRVAQIAVETRAAPVGQDLAAGIVGVADEVQAELILLATHGRTGVRRLVLGSVADAVVRTASTAVFVVNAGRSGPETSGVTVRRILVPLDGSQTAEAALPSAIACARAFDATLDLVEVIPLTATMLAAAPEVALPPGFDDELEQGAARYLARVRNGLPGGVRSEATVLRGSPAGSLIDFAEKSGTDLVVMSTHGRSGMARWALGSVADKVLRAGTTPVLLVRPSATGESGQAG